MNKTRSMPRMAQHTPERNAIYDCRLTSHHYGMSLSCQNLSAMMTSLSHYRSLMNDSMTSLMSLTSGSCSMMSLCYASYLKNCSGGSCYSVTSQHYC